MKAAVYSKYGPPEVVTIEEVPKPEPKDNEVLVKIHATSVNSGDWRLRSLTVPKGYGLLVRLAFGFRGPKRLILGMELAGVVEAVGRDVMRFKAGDRVFSGGTFGGHAEYKVVRENGPIALIPEGLSFAEAAALSFGGDTALHFLRDKAGVTRGEKVLIVGASGAVGLASVQIAKEAGAEVTAVSSGANAGLVRSLGADKVIDYREEDFTTNGEAYDVILDAMGTAPWPVSKGSLAEGGRLVLVVASMWNMIRAPVLSWFSGKRVIAGTASGSAEKTRALAELAAKGLLKPVIDRVYPFERIVEAHAYVDTGRKRGSVVVSVVDEGGEAGLARPA